MLSMYLCLTDVFCKGNLIIFKLDLNIQNIINLSVGLPCINSILIKRSLTPSYVDYV